MWPVTKPIAMTHVAYCRARYNLDGEIALKALFLSIGMPPFTDAEEDEIDRKAAQFRAQGQGHRPAPPHVAPRPKS